MKAAWNWIKETLFVTACLVAFVALAIGVPVERLEKMFGRIEKMLFGRK